ncbi:RmlC-like cupin domain-containing protein [Microdochium bolleyi]|uniref:RmlC-like cupin domain-containing protein n=1 Tax=Microdochium bolleyi TaxID=196109 RepID=A0A136IXB1_9PEZI|nr:RmlC-like cupin domain-containing protein [Microdochium bolleyi]
MAALLLTPRAAVRVTKHHIPAHGLVPNTSIQHKPLLHYHGAFNRDTPSLAAAVEAHLASVGVVDPQWRYTMYATTHFHSTTHEVLVVSRGSARLCFGGEGNPGAYTPRVERGDVVVVPAGVGHRLVEDLAEGGGSGWESFEMVGSYPRGGRPWDMCYGKAGEEEKVEAIRDLGWFTRDPIYGDDGPATE